MTRKILNFSALGCQALLFIFGAMVLITSILGFNNLQNTEAGDIGTAIGVGFGSIILVILAIFAGIYSVVALIPLIMKIVRCCGKGRGFDIVALIFDVLLIIVNIVFVVLSIEGGAVVIFIALLAVNIAAIVLNAITVKYKAAKYY